jgi:hypothetical protein
MHDGSILVADTNNHRLQRYDPTTGQLDVFPIRGLDAPTTQGLVLAEGSSADAVGAEQRLRAAGRLGPGRGTLIVDVAPPIGGKLTRGTPLVVNARATGRGLRFPKPELRTKLGGDALPLRIPVDVDAGAEGRALVELSYFWCTKGDSGACIPVQAKLDVDLDVTGGGAGGEARITHRAAPDLH